MMIHIHLFALLMLFSLSVNADTSKKQENSSTVSQEVLAKQPSPLPTLPADILSPKKKQPKKVIDKYEWMMEVKKKLPTALCHKDQYFLNCFKVDFPKCEKFAGIYLSACLDNALPKLPPKLKEEDIKYWGQMMGRCTYDLYEKFMADLKKDLPECKAPTTDEKTSEKSTEPTNDSSEVNSGLAPVPPKIEAQTKTDKGTKKP